jgi:hypothetical protein
MTSQIPDLFLTYPACSILFLRLLLSVMDLCFPSLLLAQQTVPFFYQTHRRAAYLCIKSENEWSNYTKSNSHLWPEMRKAEQRAKRAITR